MNFHQKFPKFSQNFSTICSFRPNARKINAWFVKFFEKYAKIMHILQFSWEIFWKFSQISQKFPAICVFRPNARKINSWFLIFFETYAKIMHFCNFLKKSILQIFENSPASWGLRPRTPYEAGHNLEPSEIFSCVRHWSNTIPFADKLHFRFLLQNGCFPLLFIIEHVGLSRYLWNKKLLHLKIENLSLLYLKSGKYTWIV